MKNNIIDNYYQFIEDEYSCETSDKLLGKKHFISEKFGTGDFLRMELEDGLDISKNKADGIKFNFNNEGLKENILEVGYCYKGELSILSFPGQNKYRLKAGNKFVYQMLNDIDSFKFEYNNFKAMSVHINFNIIKNAINHTREDKLIREWQKNMSNIFDENVLIIEKASYDLKNIAEEIDQISTKNMMDYMKLKLKTIEFLTTFFEEKLEQNLKNIKKEEFKKITKAKEIINKDLENIPSVNELANKLGMSIYKLQQGFKEVTGNTVYKYIQKTRVEEAEYLLKNTNKSVLEIANEIGYNNPSKFASLFRRYHQITPLKYSKLYKK